MTNAEQTLWHALKALDVQGSHFRKQAPMNGFVLDFVCHRARIVIEADGGQHGTDFQSQHDAERTAWLERQGYRVLRFWNNDVLENSNGVLEVIDAETKTRMAHMV